jgi:hypothetical protein
MKSNSTGSIIYWQQFVLHYPALFMNADDSALFDRSSVRQPVFEAAGIDLKKLGVLHLGRRFPETNFTLQRAGLPEGMHSCPI